MAALFNTSYGRCRAVPVKDEEDRKEIDKRPDRGKTAIKDSLKGKLLGPALI